MQRREPIKNRGGGRSKYRDFRSVFSVLTAKTRPKFLTEARSQWTGVRRCARSATMTSGFWCRRRVENGGRTVRWRGSGPTAPQTAGPAKGSTPGLQNAGGASAAASSSTRGDIDRLAGQLPGPGRPWWSGGCRRPTAGSLGGNSSAARMLEATAMEIGGKRL